MTKLQLYRNGSPTITVPIDENTVYTHEVMGNHIVSAKFTTNTYLDIKVDDYILFRGERYNINVQFSVQKTSNFEYRYTIDFEGYVYWLKDVVFRHLGATDFSYFGSAADHVALVVACMNQDDTGWQVGQIDSTDPINIDYSGEENGYTCKGALMLQAERFGLEFWLSGKTINLTKEAGVQTSLFFQYGRGKGLYSVTRGASEEPLYNRLYVYGGDKNIPATYRNGAKRLIFETGKIERALAVGERRRETSVVFEDIYPSRTGTITAVSADKLSISDISIDFDLNGLAIAGETPKVVFLSGLLSGYELDIGSYDASTKTITLNELTEENGMIIPSGNYVPAVGDKYTLIGISMPQSYITEAENKLLTKGTEIFNQRTRPPYGIEIDPKYMRDNGIELNAGDRVRLIDDSLGIDDMIRVTSVSFPLTNEYAITAVISDKIIYTTEVQQQIDVDKISNRVVVVDRTNAELARRNIINLRKLQSLIFDPDGYFDAEKIKPLSIETYMLSVGAKSQNFGLNGVTIDANTGGDPNHLSISAGALVHYEVEIEGLGYVWQISAADFTGLDPAKSYYLAARCRRTALTGTWVISENPIETESEAGYWNFNVGVLYPVLKGYRGFDFTKGMTFIVGDTITTGRIQSLDKLNFFDLSQGQFNLGDANTGIDWNVTSPGVLTIRGAVASSTVVVGSGGFVSAGLSGVSDNGNQSVRFWAGSDVAGKETAPFRVLNDGSYYATQGQIGNWIITNGGIINEDGTAYVIARKNFGDNKRAEAIIGANVLSATTGLRSVGLFRNTEDNEFGTNYGIIIDVSGGATNIGASITGDILLSGVIRGGGFYSKRVNSGYQMQSSDRIIVYVDNGNGTVLLPENPIVGSMVYLTHQFDNDINVTSNAQNMRFKATITNSVRMSWGDIWSWDGVYWNRISASAD